MYMYKYTVSLCMEAEGIYIIYMCRGMDIYCTTHVISFYGVAFIVQSCLCIIHCAHSHPAYPLVQPRLPVLDMDTQESLLLSGSTHLIIILTMWTSA